MTLFLFTSVRFAAIKKIDQSLPRRLYYLNDLRFIMKSFLGRNQEYDRALEIVENEEYLEDLNFDEIKRYDIEEKRIGNRKTNLRKRRELGVKNAGKIGDNKQNKKVHSKRRKIQAKTKDRFMLDN